MRFDQFLAPFKDRLPFGITFNVAPEEDPIDTIEVVPGFTLVRYNDLTVAETLLGQIVTELNKKRDAEAQIQIKILAAKLKDRFDAEEELPSIVNLVDALSLLFTPVKFIAELSENIAKGEREIEAEKNKVMKNILRDALKSSITLRDNYTVILNSDEYSKFILENNETYQKIADLSKLVESDLSIQWLIVTFFLQSRFDENWSFDKTARLPIGKCNAIYKFYELEANKGEEIVDLELPETQIEVPDKDPDTKKPLTEKEKEAYKLGKN